MSESIKKYIEIVAALRKENILTNKGSFTGQIGEWLVEQLFNGKRAASAIQEGWDVEADGKFIQVKTHSKAEGNNTRWTSISANPKTRVDELIIIVFSQNYQLMEFYQIPFEIARTRIRRLKNGQEKIRWSDVEEYRVEIDELERQEVVGLFR